MGLITSLPLPQMIPIQKLKNQLFGLSSTPLMAAVAPPA